MIGPVVDALAGAAAQISVRDDACVRDNPVIAVREDCRACQSACPAEAIELDPLKITAPPCDGCRLCLPACPAAALVERASARSDLLGAFGAVRPGQKFAIACALAKPPEGVCCLEVACLASLRWEAMVVPMLLGASAVELRRAECGECRFGAQASDMLEQVIGFSEKFSQAFGLGQINTVVTAAQAGEATETGPDPVAHRRLSRRELFSRVWGGGQDTAKELGKAVATQVASHFEQRVFEETPDDGLWLRNLVVELINRRTPVESTIPIGPLTGRPEVDEARCTRCGVCVVACPTGALPGKSSETIEKGLFLASARCTGCGYCERACCEHAIRFADHLDLHEWQTDPIELVPPAAARCQVCGAPALSMMLSLCARCYRNGQLRNSAVKYRVS